MKAKTQMNVVLAAVTTLVVPPLWAADNAQAGTVVTGEFTPKLYVFDYFKGFGTGSTQFLERYDYQKGIGNDNRSGAYLDADLSIVASDAKRDFFVLERQGFGAYNHRGTIKADSDKLGFAGYYTNFRSATGGLGFLYNPNRVAGGTDPLYNIPANTNSGFVAQFNNDSPGQTLYKIDRTTYGAALALKPELFGTTATASLGYDGYKRDGNRFASFALGGSDVTGGAARVLQRWRGFDMPVDEKMNRYTLNLGGAPGGFTLAYEGMLERFDNPARDYTVANFTPLMGGFGVASNKPIHFVPDSTLISNNLRLAKTFGSTAVAAGYGLSILDQDSFAQRQQALGYNTGKITTNSAYLNISSNALKGVGLEGFVKYYNRDNDSDFPVTGLLNLLAGEQLGVRIDRIRTLNYGLAATFRPATLKSTVTVGWKREDKDRDLTWTAVSTVAPLLNGIQPQRSLYREKTLSDELYVNWVARPMPGMILRLTPSYVWADKTGLVYEPEKSLNMKAKLSYTVSNGMLVSGFYNYKNRKNTDHSFADGLTAPVRDGIETTQKAKKTQQSAGVSLNVPVSEWINTSASLSWMQDDFETYFLRSDRRRFEAPNNAIAFIIADKPNFNVDTYVFSLGGDWQVSDPFRLNAGYTWSKSKGHTASGLILGELPEVDGKINSSVHSLSLGADYALKRTVKLKGSYVYEYYTDKVYDSLTGGYHTLMIGVALGF